MIPMDGITVASKESVSSYSYYAYGGISNTIPWVAGLYALCCKVNNAMTPELFWKGVETTASRNSNGLLMINPKGLIEHISQT